MLGNETTNEWADEQEFDISIRLLRALTLTQFMSQVNVREEEEEEEEEEKEDEEEEEEEEEAKTAKTQAQIALGRQVLLQYTADIKAARQEQDRRQRHITAQDRVLRRRTNNGNKVHNNGTPDAEKCTLCNADYVPESWASTATWCKSCRA